MEPNYSSPTVDQRAKTIAETVSEKLTLGGIPSTVHTSHFGAYEVHYYSAKTERQDICFSIQEEFEHRKQNGKLTFKFSSVYLQDQDLRAATLKEKGESVVKLVERLSEKAAERYRAEYASVRKHNDKLRQQTAMHQALWELKDGNPEYAKCLTSSVEPQKLDFTVSLTVDDMRDLLRALKVGGFAVPEETKS